MKSVISTLILTSKGAWHLQSRMVEETARREKTLKAEEDVEYVWTGKSSTQLEKEKCEKNVYDCLGTQKQDRQEFSDSERRWNLIGVIFLTKKWHDVSNIWEAFIYL